MLTELGLYRLLGENPERTWPFARRLVRPVTNLIAPSWGYGHERMPESGGLVVASNHFSELDPAVLGLHSLRTLYYMAKIELLSVPIAGELLRWTGAFAVRRGEGDRDSVRVARWAVREGHAVGVFMEGTRQQLGHPGPMHAGAAMIAIQEDVPVVPVRARHVRVDPEEPAAVLRRLGRADALRPAANGEGLQGRCRASSRKRSSGSGGWPRRRSPTASPPRSAQGSRRRRSIGTRGTIWHPELAPWPHDDWAVGPLGPVYRPSGNAHGMTGS